MAYASSWREAALLPALTTADIDNGDERWSDSVSTSAMRYDPAYRPSLALFFLLKYRWSLTLDADVARQGSPR